MDTKDRAYWVRTATDIVKPVLEALAARSLKAKMPVEGKTEDRPLFTHLEALGRSLAGISPWLELTGLAGEEETLREHYAALAREAIDAGTDPASPDYMNFTYHYQPVVDAAFLAHAMIRSPRELIDRLGPRVRANAAQALRATRGRKPHYCNWLLFGAMVEAVLFRMGEEWDPMLVDIVDLLGDLEPDWSKAKQAIVTRAKRYADIQERLISPEGTFPVVGRSIAYRFGAFQHLAQMALQDRLPDHLKPAQVRCALTAVIKRIMSHRGYFDENGWLTIGLCGHQPEAGEDYISTGSLYLCTTAFLPLGLHPSHPFWSGADEPWTACKAWGGHGFSKDKSL